MTRSCYFTNSQLVLFLIMEAQEFFGWLLVVAGIVLFFVALTGEPSAAMIAVMLMLFGYRLLKSSDY